LSVGSFSPQKNLESLLSAWKILKSDFQDIDLIIVGANSSATNSTFQRLNDPSIIFRSQISDEELADLYSNALLFVYPSIYEGFGLPVLEALACGCPTLACSGTAAEDLMLDGVTFIDMRKIEDIIESIRDGIENSASYKFKSLLSMTTVKRFTWERSAAATFDIIRGNK